MNAQHESVRCIKCKTLNSFSFDNDNYNCIRCNTALNPIQVDEAKVYRENLFKNNQENPWIDNRDNNEN